MGPFRREAMSTTPLQAPGDQHQPAGAPVEPEGDIRRGGWILILVGVVLILLALLLILL